METTGSGSAAPTSRGVVAEALSLVGSLGRHVQALSALASEEGKEAVALYLRLAVMLAAALLFATFGYVILLIFVAFLIATVFHVAWIWILLGLTILHFLVAFICANHVRNHWQTPVFASTASEIKRDLAALSSKP